jgi:phage shock protein C
MEAEPQRHLYRSRTNKVICGVCGGLGKYFGIDPLIFRILFVLIALGGGAGVLIYIIMAIIVPLEPVEGSASALTGDAKERINQFAHEVRQGAQNLAKEIKTNRGYKDRRHGALGLIIIVIGILLLLNNIFPQKWWHWNIFWPVAIILVGVLIISRRKE